MVETSPGTFFATALETKEYPGGNDYGSSMKNLLIAVILLVACPTYAEELKTVGELHTSAVYYEAVESPVFKAFKAEVQKGVKALPTFQACLQDGSPAAKVYGALGIWSVDEKKGRAAMTNLLGDMDKLSLLNGCLKRLTTVDAVAKDLLDNSDDTLSRISFIPR